MPTPTQVLQGQLLAALLLLAVDAGTVMHDGYQSWLYERGLDKVPRRVTSHMGVLVDVGWVVLPTPPYYELTDSGRLALPNLLSL